MNIKSSVVKLWSSSLGAVFLAGLALIVPLTQVPHAASRFDGARPAPLQSTTDDLVLVWNTFLGTSGGAYAAAIDLAGNVYVTGHTSANDAFVAKLNTDGNLLWTTSLGGTGSDESRAIAVDGSGSVYVTGFSGATWGNPKRPFTSNGTRPDAFVAKLSSGGSLAWNTFLGGTSNDKGYGVAVSGGNVYAVGYSVLSWGSPLQASAGEVDAFVAKLDSGGNLTWNTFLGGLDNEYGISYAAAADESGVYVSWNGVVGGPTNTTVTKLGSDGSQFWNTTIGGYGRAIAVAGSENVYVTGYMANDAFAAKLGSSGGLIWNTFLGGEGNDAGWGLAIDGSENLYVAGNSTDTWGTPMWEFSGEGDAFASKLNSNGDLIWHTFLGGPSSDVGCGIAVDSSGNTTYVAGFSRGSWGEPIQPYSGTSDDFVAKIARQFSISGQVHGANGDGFPGVTISAGPDLTGLTDASGVYTISGLSAGIYTLAPAKTGYLFMPVTRVVSVPPDITGQDFTILPGPVSVTLLLSGTANLPTDLTYIDTQGLDTTLHFPSGAVTETTTIVLTPTVAWEDVGFVLAGHAFNLTASRNNSSLPGFTFSAPVTVTIHYSDDDIRLVSEENQLVLRWWAGSEWQDAAQTCNPALSYTRDVTSNTLSVPICHLSLFGLFGPTHQIYLPFVLRNQGGNSLIN